MNGKHTGFHQLYEVALRSASLGWGTAAMVARCYLLYPRIGTIPAPTDVLLKIKSVFRPILFDFLPVYIVAA